MMFQVKDSSGDTTQIEAADILPDMETGALCLIGDQEDGEMIAMWAPGQWVWWVNVTAVND